MTWALANLSSNSSVLNSSVPPSSSNPTCKGSDPIMRNARTKDINSDNKTYHIIIDFGILYKGECWKYNNLESFSQERAFLGMYFHKTCLYVLFRQYTQVLVHHLARPIVAVEMADDAVAGLDGREEVLLGGDLVVVAVAEGDPTAALLRHFLHLLNPPFPQRLQIVLVKPIKQRDLLVQLLLHGLSHCEHLLL
uniref:Uncharacterized protein MANES_07G065600 n=1 Tax=Rhizophora mucronata TaxID=61149 RepID=A0A2P2J2V4_RHIMU